MLMLKLKDNEDGFAALVIALVLIVVLSLTTIGFIQLMSSNEQTALSKQLSSQAYYAAESGINDAEQAYAAGYTIPKAQCNNSNVVNTEAGFQYLETPDVNSSTNTGVTCLLMNPTPSSLIYGAITSSQPTVVEMQGCSTGASASASSACGYGSGVNAGTINITWQDANDTNGLTSSCSSLYPQAGGSQNWTKQNILRIDLIPVSGSVLNRQSLIGSAYTAYLCPDNTSGGASVNVAAQLGTNSGQILDSACTPVSGSGAPYNCTTKLNVAGLNNSTYFLIMRAIYSNNIQATITMQDSSTNTLDIGDAQLLVDSTGKSQNVLKRIQVRIPETDEYDMPEAVIQGQVCKQLGLLPSNALIGSSTDSSPCASDNIAD